MRRSRLGLNILDGALILSMVLLVTVFLWFVSKKDGLEDAAQINIKSEESLEKRLKALSRKIKRKDIADIFSVDEISQFNNGWTDEENERFLSYIRQHWLVAPSQGPLNISLTVQDPSQHGQGEYVDKILHQKTDGFFVECGAGDGQTLSNSLSLEQQRNWTGLLIEPNPDYFQRMLLSKRKAYAINSCASTGKSTERVHFKPLGIFGGIVGKMGDTHLKFLKKLPHYKTKDITVQCFTFSSMLLALGQFEVDYFSLDVNGPELDILETIPFNKLRIRVISVKYAISDNVQINRLETLKKLEHIRNFFEILGNYAEVAILPWGTHNNKEMEEERGFVIIFKRIE